MRNNSSRKLMWSVGILACILIAEAALIHARLLFTYAGAQAVWNETSADVFVDARYEGYDMSYLRLAAVYAEAYFNHVTPAQNVHDSLIVLHFSKDSFTPCRFDGVAVHGIELFEGNLFVDRESDHINVLKIWTGSGFRQPSADELHQLFVNPRERHWEPNFDNISGWSKRIIYNGGSDKDHNQPTSLHITLDGQPLLLAIGGFDGGGLAFVDASFHSQAMQRVWVQDTHSPQFVTRGQYEKILAQKDSTAVQ